MEKSLVSVIIPAYNAEKYMEETLLSVLASSYLPIEVIVVNDGSDDGTEQIAKSFANKFSNFHYFKPLLSDKTLLID